MAKMLINGQSVSAVSGKTLDVLSPVDGLKFETIPRGEAADVDAAVRAANAALDGPWGKMTALERGRLLMKLGEKVLANHAELSLLEAKDTGKPMTTARTDITVLARYFEYYGSADGAQHRTRLGHGQRGGGQARRGCLSVANSHCRVSP